MNPNWCRLAAPLPFQSDPQGLKPWQPARRSPRLAPDRCFPKIAGAAAAAVGRERSGAKVAAPIAITLTLASGTGPEGIFQAVVVSVLALVAHPDIPDNHADVSSAAAEIYAMGTATMEIVALSYTYVCSDSGIAFPRTFVQQVDNGAAQDFASHLFRQEQAPPRRCPAGVGAGSS